MSCISLKIFLEYGHHLSKEPYVEDPIQQVKTYHSFRHHALGNAINPEAPKQMTNQVWSYLRGHIDAFKNKEPEEIQVTQPFINQHLSPLIPDSFFLKNSRHENRFIRAVTTIGLIVEVAFREVAAFFVSLGLKFYSSCTPDKASYYQFRLELNRHRPLYAIRDKILRLLGGF
ncbi:MAG: hypothetical protein FJZ63_04780 [Chlamydiae bacterium]|nr:hypothetical protein [Chlamydiota bacterium]